MMRVLTVFLGVLFTLFLGACASGPMEVDTSATDERSYDGLYPIRNSTADAAWSVSDLDLSGYKKVMLQSAGISYKPAKKVSSASSAFRRGQTEFPMSDSQKAKFRSVVREAFLKELEKGEQYTFTDKPGPDVLLVRGALMEVVSEVPPEHIGRGEIFLTSIGEATLLIELRDSMSDAILVRAIDRRAAENIGGTLQVSNRVTNAQEVRRLARHWAKALRTRLDEFMVR